MHEHSFLIDGLPCMLHFNYLVPNLKASMMYCSLSSPDNSEVATLKVLVICRLFSYTKTGRFRIAELHLTCAWVDRDQYDECNGAQFRILSPFSKFKSTKWLSPTALCFKSIGRKKKGSSHSEVKIRHLQSPQNPCLLSKSVNRREFIFSTSQNLCLIRARVYVPDLPALISASLDPQVSTLTKSSVSLPTIFFFFLMICLFVYFPSWLHWLCRTATVTSRHVLCASRPSGIFFFFYDYGPQLKRLIRYSPSDSKKWMTVLG